MAEYRIAAVLAGSAAEAAGVPTEMVAHAVADHRGRLVSDRSTRIIAEFDDPVDALRCAVMVQRVMLANGGGASGLALAVAVGDVHDDGTALVGAPVEAAFGLAEHTPCGGVAVTASAYELIEGGDEFQFEDPAPHDASAMTAGSYRLSASVFSADRVDATVNDLLAQSAEMAKLDQTMIFGDSSSGKLAERGIVSRLLTPTPKAAPSRDSAGASVRGAMGQLLHRITFGLLAQRSASEAARTTRVKQVVEAIEADTSLMDAGAAPYAVIESYRKAIGMARSAVGLENLVQRLASAQRLVERRLYFSGSAMIEGLGHPVLIRFGRLLQIGRSQDGANPDVAIGCSLVSRAGRQAQISLTASGFQIEDLGSSNGTFVDNRLLEPGDRVLLGAVAELAFGGKRAPPRKGVCRMKARTLGTTALVLSISFATEHVSAAAASAMAEDWKSYSTDVCKTWLLAERALLIGGARHCAIRLAVGSWPPEMASIELASEGYVIRPLSPVKVVVDGTWISDIMPLRQDANIKIGYLSLYFRSG
jgi:hypothetical protein